MRPRQKQFERVAFAARTTGAYARIRQQFGIPIGKFEGIQTRLGRMAATCDGWMRLGDILSELYFLSAVLKRWEEDGRQNDDLPLVKYGMQQGFSMIENRYAAVLKNMPSRPVAWLIRLFARPFGLRRYGPSDALVKVCAATILAPSDLRDRLTEGRMRPCRKLSRLTILVAMS